MPSVISTRKIVPLLAIVLLALVVRGLTANFIRAHLNDPGWFQFGTFKIFDRQAQDVLDGKQPFFWISDSTRTDLIQYPPGNLVWIGAVYTLTGERSAESVQRVQWVLNAFAVLLIVGIAVTAYGWTIGIVAGVLAALSPLLALYSATPGADVPTSWFVLAAVWLSLLAFKRKSVWGALGAGALLGLSCWLRVNPLLLFVPWAIALYFLVTNGRKRRPILAVAISASALLIVAPLIARNLIVFYPQVALTGLSVGGNLLAGIGETDRGAEFGAPCCDAEVIEQDRRAMGLPPDAPLGLVYPDGIRRDRQRGQRALAIIKAHPVWYAGVMVRRALGHLKLAGKPSPILGSTGVNVTSSKCLPTNLQFVPLSTAVNSLGIIQSVLRYTALLFMVWGIWIALRSDFRITLLILSTVAYFLVTLAVGHSEIRYGLPMQAVLIVFQARGLYDVVARIKRRRVSNR
jgi:4-amino-4-deoxy-L-arabinose transferase-like glycosyltransferase